MGVNERFAPSFDLLDDRGIEIVDPVGHRRFRLHVPAVGDLRTRRDDPFHVPVDSLASFRGDRIQLREAVSVVVRDGRGEMVTEVEPLAETDLPADEYHLELNGPIKVCLRVVGALTISGSVGETSIELPRRCRVDIGARSYHRQPAATIATSADPEEMAVALSFLASALKTTSPERAYPTLRGHPPAIELADQLEVPSGLSRPDTGVSIEVPGDYRALYAVAPLAYYLAADVTLGDRARIVTDTGFVHALDGQGGVERAVERVLKRVFFLDCVTRTEGFYRLPLFERRAVEPELDLDFGSLYDQPLARQLEAYLEVPYETVEPHVPTWNLVAHVPSTPGQIEVLPYVIDQLALIRSPDARTLSSTDVRTAVLSSYADHKSGFPAPSRVRSAESGGGESDEERIVELPETDSMEDAWFGEAAPLNATKSLVQAYRNRLDRPDRDWPIDIAVVCNERDMKTESTLADSVYGSRTELPFDVTRHRNLTVDELRPVLASEVDFLHYIGHTTAEGFHCRDGRLDAATLDVVGAETFFLNSCRSYRQGVHLIEAGSVGGVVTLSEVNDEGAAAVGGSMARLLNRGFPLRAAVQLAARTSVIGGHYITVGDGTADLGFPETGLPLACRVAEADEDQYDVSIQVFLPREGGMGTTVYPLFASNEQHYLAPGMVSTFRVSEEELLDHLRLEPIPVISKGELILEGHSDRLGS